MKFPQEHTYYQCITLLNQHVIRMSSISPRLNITIEEKFRRMELRCN